MSFKDLQVDFAKWLRDPQSDAQFAAIEPRRLAIYKRLIHNNIKQFLRNGFPVLQSVLTSAQWQQLERDFIAQHQAKSPLFSQIGQEFVDFLAHYLPLQGNPQQTDFPPWTFELAHYERVEVDVRFKTLQTEWQPLAAIDEETQLNLNPTAYLGIYDFPVARISPDYQPESKPNEPYFVLVYQELNGDVKFLELNPLTAFVVEQLQQKPHTLTQLFEVLKVQFSSFDQVVLQQGLQQLVVDFAERSLLLLRP
ncbi:HvfC family RiPP maturation protein [Pseudidiomarina salilacus]|uniref:HvfC family RiPP maturation protein n=1 Tax=Pseudidiomarina salilacus TaxID=3384452 RepID=UPI0039856886